MRWLSGIGLGMAASAVSVAAILSISHTTVEGVSPFFWLMNLDLAIVGVGLAVYSAVKAPR